MDWSLRISFKTKINNHDKINNNNSNLKFTNKTSNRYPSSPSKTNNSNSYSNNKNSRLNLWTCLVRNQKKILRIWQFSLQKLTRSPLIYISNPFYSVFKKNVRLFKMIIRILQNKFVTETKKSLNLEIWCNRNSKIKITIHMVPIHNFCNRLFWSSKGKNVNVVKLKIINFN
jgi:hypothetical protein